MSLIFAVCSLLRMSDGNLLLVAGQAVLEKAVLCHLLGNKLIGGFFLKLLFEVEIMAEEKKEQKLLLEKHKDIARIDQEIKRTHGWYVRVRYYGKTHSKFFSDGKCGGRYSSLLAAVAWRDQTEKKLGKVRSDKHIVTVSNTTTGVVGVRLNDTLSRYEVSWVNGEGKQGKTSVSIRKHGKEAAFKRACDIRLQKESQRLNV